MLSASRKGRFHAISIIITISIVGLILLIVGIHSAITNNNNESLQNTSNDTYAREEMFPDSDSSTLNIEESTDNDKSYQCDNH